MVKRNKNYFSFYGILIATTNRKINSISAQVSTFNSRLLPLIIKLLNKKQLKPIKLYSTNQILQDRKLNG